MANEQNLRPGEYKLSQEEAKRGGIASGAARREKKRLRELAQMILDENITDKSTGTTMTRGEAALRVQARKAIQDGDVRALEFLRDTAGQKPVERVETVEIPPEAYERVTNAITYANGALNGDTAPLTAK